MWHVVIPCASQPPGRSHPSRPFLCRLLALDLVNTAKSGRDKRSVRVFESVSMPKQMGWNPRCSFSSLVVRPFCEAKFARAHDGFLIREVLVSENRDALSRPQEY